MDDRVQQSLTLFNLSPTGMKKTLLSFTLTLTTASGAIALHLASLPTPTEAQKALSTTANTIALSGTGAIFAMLNDGDRDEDDDTTE